MATNKQEKDRSRLSITAAFCIVLGILLGFVFKRIHIGLMIGLALGLLSGGLLSKRRR